MSEPRYLIDATDDRFKTAANADVVEFIRQTSPFAHGDVGSLLFDLAKQMTGTFAYCPSTRSFAYVVLHNSDDRIFAIAFGQRAVAFRLSDGDQRLALESGGTRFEKIGADWVSFDAWDASRKTTAMAFLEPWAERALANSQQ